MSGSGRRRKPQFKCRGPREEDGGPCQLGVSRPGERCRYHRGLPEVPPGGRLPQYIKRAPKKARKKAARKAPARTPRVPRARTPDRPTVAMAQPRFVMSERTREALVAEAVDDFDDFITSGAIDTVVNRAAGYVGDEIWSELTRDWRGRNCKGLARLARMTLRGKDWVHGRIGLLAGSLLEWIGTPRIAQVFGRELAKRIPMPWDHQCIVLARGMQIAGIVICVLNDRGLARCDCFVDVVITEGKERVEELMQKAAESWLQLDQLIPSN